MTNSELLQQVRVIDPVSGNDRIADVLIADGAIAAVEETISDLSSDTLVRDCRGIILGPGLVDLYSHSGEPGFEERETLESLMQAAQAGGFTRVAILPDTKPPLDNPAGLARLQKLAADITDKLSISPPLSRSPALPLYFWGAMTLGVQGQQMTELAELANSEVVGFSDGQPLQNLALLRRLLEYLKPLQKPIAIWPQYLELAGNGVMREGFDSIRLGLPGIPAISETSALAALLEVVEAIGTPVHIMRVSTGRSVQLIWEAKVRGLPVTASTTWMHLLLDTEAVSSYNPSLHLDPPLGSPADRTALRRAVQQGILDAIAIDHRPYSYEEKTVAFAEAPPGAIGLELALPLLWQTLVATGEWSALELWRVLSTQPALCLKQTPAAIAPGQPAELILFDPQLTWTVEKQTLKSRSSNTPWLGQQVTGRVVQ
ncbi:dihydroorotase [Argonema antarcticum]|uniref:dihydroorotase n=1 Tax=Argonema antarcticum TaxID=2942763 RepID=UPI0020129CCB|nr:dihydroorotase [Argonema antarcticum]MCL1473690.1 dihydroorotase [Argonema antarcticum A004/B2]